MTTHTEQPFSSLFLPQRTNHACTSQSGSRQLNGSCGIVCVVSLLLFGFCHNMMPLADIILSVTVLVAVFIVLFVWRSRRMLRFFEDIGIPGPKPDLIWGNWKQFSRNRIATLTEWKKQYGSVFGIYMGSDPFLIITDPDVAHECFVRQGALFQDRPLGLVDAEPFKSSLLQLNGSTWKSVRAPLNYAFSPSVVKELSVAANSCSSRFVDRAARISRTNGHVELFECALGLTFDFIMNAVLAQEVNAQENTTYPLFKGLKQVCKDMENSAIEVVFSVTGVRTLLTWLYPFTKHSKAFKGVRNIARNTAKLCRSGKLSLKVSILQALLDANAKRYFSDVHQGPAKRGRHLDDRYIFSNAAIFVLAGFETTATALSFLLYILATHPSEQDEVVRELEDLFPNRVGQDLSFDELRQLKRLDLTILEGLRLYPPIPVFLARKCARHTVACGRLIPAGVNVLAVPWLIHRDPVIWPDPEQFRPERFSENRESMRSGTYVPFGMGQRVCIGEKLALLLVKCALVKVLQDFRLTLCDEVVSPLSVSDRGFALIPEGLMIHLEHRV